MVAWVKRNLAGKCGGKRVDGTTLWTGGGRRRWQWQSRKKGGRVMKGRGKRRRKEGRENYYIGMLRKTENSRGR